MRFFYILLLCVAPAFTANRYFVSGGVDNNWGTTGNWSLTDGGAGGQTVPSSSDDVFFTSNSPNCTVNTSTRNALSLTFTGYTNTITMSQNITVSGNVTLASSMGISGSGVITLGATGTLTSNGKAWPNGLFFGQFTYTLADNWSVTGPTTFSATTGTTTLNGNTLTLSGNSTWSMTSGLIAGTTVFKLAGTMSLTAASYTSGKWTNPVTIDAGGGTVTVNAPFPVNFGQLNFVSGTVTTTAGTWASGSGSTTKAYGWVK